MAGAGDGTGAALKKRPHSFSCSILLIFVVAVTPFCWLIGRDMVSISFTSNEKMIEERKRLIFAGLVDEVQRHRDLEHTPSRTTASTVLNYPACETIIGGKVRIDHQTTRTKSDPVYRNPAEVLGFFRSVAPDRLAVRGYKIGQTSRALGHFEASFLRACIASTPFQNACLDRYEGAVAKTGSSFEEALLELGFLKAVDGPAGASPRYCYSLPIVETAGERP